MTCMPRRNLWTLLLAALVSYTCYVRADHTPYSRHLAHAYRAINRQALQDPPDRELFDAAMEGMVAELRQLGDEHSEYIAAVRTGQFNAEIRQEFGGIGVRITLRGDEPPRELVIVCPPEPGEPAAAHDIRSRDKIVAIDGIPVDTMDTSDDDEILRRMRGPVGEPVKLTILHAGETVPVEIEVVRSRISIDSVHGLRKNDGASWRFRLDEEPRIAYARITTFGEKTPVELYEALEALSREGVEGVILDLRDNAGGELQGTIDICDMFLPAGKTIVQTRDRRGRVEEVYRATGETPFGSLPLAVLVNRYSASASEIVAACLQDHDRAAIIGERSFGKGTVQRLLDVGPPVWLDDEYQSSMLKLTTASYWRPSGRNIHRILGDRPQEDAEDRDEGEWGVSPDPGMEVKLTPHEREAFLIDRGRRELYNPAGDALFYELDKVAPEVQALLPFEDEALAKAIEYLKRQ
jgi:carboxyl-terminal processing protease